MARLLEAGYRVRTTVRTPARAEHVRQSLRVAGAEPDDALGFAVADLTSDEGWADAVRGCDYVLHVASPFPSAVPRHEDELIVPARDGSLRVLRAARDAGVRRVVLTSSFAAVSYGHPGSERTFTEQDWTDLDGPGMSAYAASKTLAERAAWDFVDRAADAPELAVVNPVGVIGPVLGRALSTSSTLVQRLLNRDLPVLPRLSFALVDVRDVADLHLRAMTDPAARGERFLAAAGPALWVSGIAQVLRERLGVRVPRREAPDVLVRLASRVDPSLRVVVHRSVEESIVDSARSMIELGLVKISGQPGAGVDSLA
ncbi:SDR family oxidoreductase [Amycolatopsis jiangsuensis]|uniref:SDR family oxidoreductase n=1 Tax=Amycolatopsis jiangsuensis TaxID=1181879 RepID=UPI00362882FC